MKKIGSVSDGDLIGSPFGQLANRVLHANNLWGDLERSLRSCFVRVVDPERMEADPWEMLRVLAKCIAQPEVVTEVGEILLIEAQRLARASADAAVQSFDMDLRRLSAKDEIAVTGRFPNYTLAGFLPIRVDLQKGCTRLGTRTYRSIFARRFWPLVTAEIHGELDRRPTPEIFLAECAAAYRETLGAKTEILGALLPIRDLYFALRKSARFTSTQLDALRKKTTEYTEEHFKRDLASLISAGCFVTSDGLRLELLPTAFAKDGIAVLVGEGVRYIGRVTFRPANI